MAKVNLAQEPDFVLGRLRVLPLTRELFLDDGQREVLEHRIMEVFVVLAQARGQVVSRDELIERCWGGRAVSEDAINRVISRLRKVAGGIGKGSFDIETITKVGYRLASDDSASDGSRTFQGAALSTAATRAKLASRRTVLLAGATVLAAGAAGGVLVYRELTRPALSPEMEALMAQGWQVWAQATSSGPDQAIGFYRRATELDPGYADAWGLLGCTYADAAHRRSKTDAGPLRERARSAARQALDLDPSNAYGRCALAYARPMRGNWLLMEREFRHARADQPDRPLVFHGLGSMLLRVGRSAEAADQLALLRINPDPPITYYLRVMAEWGTGRIEQAERLSEEGLRLYPVHPALWYLNLDLAMFGGKPGKALAQIGDDQGRPSGMQPDEIARLTALGNALEGRDPEQAETAMKAGINKAPNSRIDAENAIKAAAALGRLDEAFRLLDAFYFSRGFLVPDAPSQPGHPAVATLEERDTMFLFLPVMQSVRADPRFGRLTEALGLERYWRDAGKQPDFRRT